MDIPEQSNPPPVPAQKAFDFLTPASFIHAARDAHPMFRYAMVVAGLLAIVTTFNQFSVSSATLIFGAIVLLGLMVVFFVFAQLPKVASAHMDWPVKVLVWGFLTIVLTVSTLLTSSAFLNRPLRLRDYLEIQLGLTASDGLPKPSSDSSSIALIGAQLESAYLADLTFASAATNWGQEPSKRTLRITGDNLVVTINDSLGIRTVRTNVNPELFPRLRETLPILNSNQAETVSRFITSHSEFLHLLDSLSDGPVFSAEGFRSDYISVVAAAEKAVTDGRNAICSLKPTLPTRQGTDPRFPQACAPLAFGPTR
jgi:hypothetical protein